MFTLCANLNPLATGADEVFQCGIHVERIAHLVKVGDLQVRALANLAAVGFELTQNHLQQRAFAYAIGANQTHLVTPQERG